MNLSLNEVEVTAKKAARGAGYSWGLAEEAGKATRWLCAQGLDGCGILASLLSATDGQDLSRMSPTATDKKWQAASGHLCPLTAGASLSDHATQISQSGLDLSSVLSPLFLIPFAARLGGRSIRVEWDGGSAVTDGENLSLSSTGTPNKSAVTVRMTDQTVPVSVAHTRAEPRDQDWSALIQLTGRTYAPATEESRLLGAGSGLSDAD
jgi:Protein of unknown function (DUF3726)